MTARQDGAREGRGRDGATEQAQPLCTTCWGRGWVYSYMELGGTKNCPTCKGSGRKTVQPFDDERDKIKREMTA